MQLEIKRARLFGFRDETRSVFDRILRNDRRVYRLTETLDCQTHILFLIMHFDMQLIIHSKIFHVATYLFEKCPHFESLNKSV